MLNNKLLLLLGLVTSSFAAPTFERSTAKHDQENKSILEDRAAGIIPNSVNCNSKTFTRAQILAALEASWTPAWTPGSRANPDGKEYPNYNGNRGRDPVTMKEYPLLTSAAAKKSVTHSHMSCYNSITDLTSR